MGNCLALCKLSSGSGMAGAMAKQGKMVRVAKPDGKILEFSSPILVKDILTNFPAFEVFASKEASEHLSPDYELKAGRFYYLLPSLCYRPNVSFIGNTEPGSGIKRVKVVITKQQLEQLVTKQVSIEDILSEVKNRTVDLPSNWKPKLDSIPEGIE